MVRWRIIDLCQWVWEEFKVSVSKQTMSRELRTIGYRKLSARPRHHAQAEGAIEASVEQIRELNEQAIKSARAGGQRALDAYQAALESVVDAEQKLAEGSQLDWFTTLVTTQAEFTQRLGAIFLTAAREQLK